ncbi:hypothetical protein [Azospirillum oryzae]|uniref:hypothetical protein n=1 Tax=Azospirillum oryzae TaxID=286727 RepID=UPI0011773D57|nr:hypothetical protein [Azospirillum oryzae]
MVAITTSTPSDPIREELMAMFNELPPEDTAHVARLAWAMANRDVDGMLNEADALGLREPVEADIHADPERYAHGGAA